MPSVWEEKGRGVVLQRPVCSVLSQKRLERTTAYGRQSFNRATVLQTSIQQSGPSKILCGVEDRSLYVATRLNKATLPLVGTLQAAKLVVKTRPTILALPTIVVVTMLILGFWGLFEIDAAAQEAEKAREAKVYADFQVQSP